MLKEEIQFIYDNCETYSANKFKEKFPHNSFSTMKKMKSNFTKFKKNEKDNLEFINNNLEMTTSEFEKYFNFTDNGIINKIFEIFDIEIKRRDCKSYYDNEIYIVKNYYHIYGPTICAEILGHKDDKAYIKRLVQLAGKLNIKSKLSEYTQEEFNTIKKMCNEGYTPIEISLKINRPISGIQNFIYRNNLKYNYTNCCANRFIPSAPELYMINKFSEILDIKFPDKMDIKNKDYYWGVLDGMEIDLPIYINDFKFAIEYDGSYWHKNNSERDTKKTKLLEDLGFIVFRISDKDERFKPWNYSSMDCIIQEICDEIMGLIKRLELTGTPLETNTLSLDSDILDGSEEKSEV